MRSDSDNFLTEYLPYLLRRVDQTLSEPFYALLTSHGIARSEWRVLAVLQELGDLGVVDLAAAALSPQPTVTHALRRLEQRALVTRTPGAKDRRQRLVSITATGSALTINLMSEATRLEADLLAEAGDLSDLMARLHELTALVETATHRSSAPAEAG